MRQLLIRDLWAEPGFAPGAMDFDLRGDSISPRRLPAWTRMQVPQMMDVMVRMPSGVRLRFNTDSTRVGLGFHATNLVTPPAERRSIVFNLESEGRLQSARSTAGNSIVLNPAAPGDFTLERGQADTVWFEDLPAADKTCELWLPHNAFVSLSALQLDDDAAFTQAAADTRKRWLHYGSSISHCMEAEQPALTWPAVAARQAGFDLRSLGFGGQCHLDQFVARTIRDSDADLITLKTGINVINMDSMRERVFEPALHGFLDTLREGQPDTPVMVISPIFCPSAEDNPGPTLADSRGRFVTIPGNENLREGCLSLTRVRTIVERVIGQRRHSGDRNLHYFNGLELFGSEDAGDLPDDLHPNPDGYIRMGERFAPHLLSLADRSTR